MDNWPRLRTTIAVPKTLKTLNNTKSKLKALRQRAVRKADKARKILRQKAAQDKYDVTPPSDMIADADYQEQLDNADLYCLALEYPFDFYGTRMPDVNLQYTATACLRFRVRLTPTESTDHIMHWGVMLYPKIKENYKQMSMASAASTTWTWDSSYTDNPYYSTMVSSAFSYRVTSMGLRITNVGSGDEKGGVAQVLIQPFTATYAMASDPLATETIPVSDIPTSGIEIVWNPVTFNEMEGRSTSTANVSALAYKEPTFTAVTDNNIYVVITSSTPDTTDNDFYMDCVMNIEYIPLSGQNHIVDTARVTGGQTPLAEAFVKASELAGEFSLRSSVSQVADTMAGVIREVAPAVQGGAHLYNSLRRLAHEELVQSTTLPTMSSGASLQNSHTLKEVIKTTDPLAPNSGSSLVDYIVRGLFKPGTHNAVGMTRSLLSKFKPLSLGITHGGPAFQNVKYGRCRSLVTGPLYSAHVIACEAGHPEWSPLHGHTADTTEFASFLDKVSCFDLVTFIDGFNKKLQASDWEEAKVTDRGQCSRKH